MRAFVLLLGLLVVGQVLGAEVSRRVTVSGVGEMRAEPDRARVHLSAQAEDREAGEARRLVDEQLSGLVAALESAGLDDDALITGQISLAPQYDYGGMRRRFRGYLARRDVQVDVDDLERLNPLLDAALDEGIEGFQYIEYESSREDELRAQARDLAIADSKRVAEELAAAYGVQLGPVVSICLQNDNSIPYPQTYAFSGPEFVGMDMAAIGANTAMAMPYMPDDLTFVGRIEVVFELLVE